MPESLRVLAPIVAAFVLLMAVMAWAFDVMLERRHNPNLHLASGQSQRIVLERNPAGRYVVPGKINGRQVTFLVDTGADTVAVPSAVADRIGLERGRRIGVATAGGLSTAYATRIPQITVGGIHLQDVRGSITPAMGGDAILLGMTFLRHVNFSQQGDRLIIEATD